MQLTDEQVAAYDRDGFVVLPGLFSAEAVAEMKAELMRLAEIETEVIAREPGSRSAKVIFRMHETDGPTASPPFRRAVCSRRLLGPARQLLRDDALYLHHSTCTTARPTGSKRSTARRFSGTRTTARGRPTASSGRTC